MNSFGIIVLFVVFIVASINYGQKRKRGQEQRERRIQQAYVTKDERSAKVSTIIEREIREREESLPQVYGEGYSAWEVTPYRDPQPRNEEEHKHRGAVTLAVQRAEALRRERMEHAERNKSEARQGEYALTEGISGYGQEGICVEGGLIKSNLNRHKLEASSISGHAHTESSLDDRADNCDDYAIRDDAMEQLALPIPTMLQFNNEDIVKGFIFSEILSKPKALRR